MEEIWKDIKDYKGDYQISNYGNVKSIKFNKEKMLKGRLSCGYHTIQLCKNDVKTYYVHRLVAQVFLGLDIIDKLIDVDHIDNCKTNNKLENLQLLNHRENNCKKIRKTSSKYIGVTWNKKDKKWQSYIQINKKSIYLGSFDDQEEAHQAYLKALEDYNIENKYSKYEKQIN